MTALITIGCILTYALIGTFTGNFVYHKWVFDAKHPDWGWWDDPGPFLSSVFWPIAWAVIVMFFLVKYLYSARSLKSPFRVAMKLGESMAISRDERYKRELDARERRIAKMEKELGIK